MIELTNNKMGHFKVDGLLARQHKNALSFFKILKQKEPNISRIIEIGTANGGLSLYLKKYIFTKLPLITYDIDDVHDIVKNLCDFRQKNIFSKETIKEIAELIQQKGQILLLCDNGNKIGEFSTFSAFLKTNDIIMAHDYNYSKKHAKKMGYDKLWKFVEITHDDVKESVSKYNLVRYLEEFAEPALWGCYKKC